MDRLKFLLDKILVMDKGKIAEFDSPTALKAIDGNYTFVSANA